METNRPALLDTKQAAAFLTLRPVTLETWRARPNGGPLRFIRLGRAIRYRVEDLERFLAEQAEGGER